MQRTEQSCLRLLPGINKKNRRKAFSSSSSILLTLTFAMQTAAFPVLCQFRFCQLCQCCKSFCIINSHVSQNLSVHFNTCQLQSIHEFAVGQTIDSCCCVDTSDPQLSELTFFLLSSCISSLSVLSLQTVLLLYTVWN